MKTSLHFSVLLGIFLTITSNVVSQETEFNPLGRDIPIETLEKLLRIQVEWI